VPKKKSARGEQNALQRMTGAIQRYFRETIGELRKVSWPTRQEAINLTKIVLVVIFAMSIFLGVLDIIYTQLFALILG
jgi:preprotein translocase subunit SecE